MRALLLLGLACGGQEAKENEETGGPCADLPVLTWDNFGQGFLIENCQACHASSSPNRNGAPEDVTFDTEEQALAWADAILATAGGEAPRMPPEGGVSDDDRQRLEIWLNCYRE
jgi:uncharacterized membrane protein